MDTYFKTKDYRQVNEVPGYDDEERIELLSHLQSVENPSTYDLAIMLMFCFTVRIGELKVLNTDSFNARLKKDVMNVESDIYLHTKSNFLTVLCF